MNLTNALIAKLHIKMLGNRTKDEILTDEVHSTHGMSEDTGGYYKCPLPPTCFAAVHAAARSTRAKHKQLTFMSPYGSVLPTGKIEAYNSTLREMQERWDEAVSDFVRTYPQNLALARQRLNGAFKEEDYPSPLDVARCFRFEFLLLPLPNANALDDLVGLADSRVRQMREQLATTSREAEAGIRRQLLNRILVRVQNLGNALANPSYVPNAAVLDRFTQMLDDVAVMNITQDPEITRLVNDCRQHLVLSAERLRNEPVTRTHTLAAASLLLQSHGRRIETPKASA
jgi:hypothetical protein